MKKSEQIEVNDWAIDLETLGRKRGAAILSIGCVQFDRHTGRLGAEFYAEIDLPSTLKCGDVEPATLAWWVNKHPVVFGKLIDPSVNKAGLATTLDTLSKFIRNASAGIPVVKGSLGPGTPHVWGNGATFDISILEEAFAVGGYGLTVPWHFMHIRDLRTLLDAARHVSPNYESIVPNIGTAHDALDDAKYQALVACEAFHVLKSKKFTLPKSLTATKVEVDQEDDEL